MATASKHITVIEHETGCPLDEFARWMDVDVDIVRPYLGDPVPSHPADGLIVLGGTENALADDVWPWLPAVRQLLVNAVDDHTPTLGICLGHQLLGVALGGELVVGAQRQDDPTYKGPEYGVTALHLMDAGAEDELLGGAAIDVAVNGTGAHTQPLPSTPATPSPPVTMMHGDVLKTLPEGAALLASTDLYPNAAFRMSEAAWGVQFHPEASLSTFASWVEQTPKLTSKARARLIEQAHAEHTAVTEFARAIAIRFAKQVCAAA